MSERKLRVFLSYAAPDKATVREVYRSLLAVGWIDPWFDEENLLAGQDFDFEIEKTLHSADAVIMFISSNSVPREGYVQRELRYALDIALEKPEGTIFVIPLRLEEIQPPARLRAWHYVDYFPSNPDSPSFYKLIRALKARADNLGIWTGDAQRTRGIVSSAPQGRFYGFISEEGTARPFFVHFGDVMEQNQRLVEGEKVEFDIRDGPKGLQAISVKRIIPDTSSSPIAHESIEEVVGKLAEEFKKARQREFTFLLVGRTGVGKSSTVNTLIGKQVAEVGDFRPTTFTVKYFRSEIQGVKFSIVDTPGLCDGLPQKSKDKIYLREIKQKVSSIDCVLFTTPLPESRVGRDELEGISQITEVFGKEIWDRAIIVFTKADLVHPAEYVLTFRERTKVLVEALAEFAGRDIAKRIPSVAVSNKLDRTPDHRLWLGELYIKVFAKISEQAALPFFLATADRLVTTDSQMTQRENTAELSSPQDTPVSRIRSQSESHPQNTSGAPPAKKILLDEKQQETLKSRFSGFFERQIEMIKEHPWMTAGYVLGDFFGPWGAPIGGAIGGAVEVVISLFKKKKSK